MKGVTKEPGRDKVDRACKRGDSQFTLGMANMNLPITQTKENRSDDVTNLYNQEMKEYIVTEHNAKLINKDQPSMEDVITSNADKEEWD